jgi:hypothetical protein
MEQTFNEDGSVKLSVKLSEQPLEVLVELAQMLQRREDKLKADKRALRTLIDARLVAGEREGDLERAERKAAADAAQVVGATAPGAVIEAGAAGAQP